MIEDSVGFEVARESSLSLIPGEPVDLSRTLAPALLPTVMLMMLKGLFRGQPRLSRTTFRRKWMNREQVSTSMILQGHNLDIILFPGSRMNRGISRLDYSLALKSPQWTSASPPRRTIGLMYSLQIRVQVFDRDTNKLIFRLAKRYARTTFDKSRYTRDIKDKLFCLRKHVCLFRPEINRPCVSVLTDRNIRTFSYRTEPARSPSPKIDATQFQGSGNSSPPLPPPKKSIPVAALPFFAVHFWAGVHFVPSFKPPIFT